jgi:hypothetical protein
MDEINGHHAHGGTPLMGSPMSFILPRPRNQWLAFLPPVLICGLSWIAGGIPRMTDLGFLMLAGACALFLFAEMRHSSQRFGIGGILLFGGVLVWFCHDYFVNWFLRSEADFTSRPETVAKAAYYYSLFILCMSLGLRTGGGRWLQRVILSVPEPGGENTYFLMVLILFAFGIFPFMFFSNDSFFTALFHGAFSSWVGPVHWSVGRTGNLNYNWGAYLAQVLQAGAVGGIFASFFAIMISTRLSTKIVSWSIWAFWTFYSYNEGRRGPMAFMILPPVGLFFIKYQSQMAGMFRKHSFKAYVTAGSMALLLLTIVQIQGAFRGISLANVDMSKVDLTANRGNSMFSEALKGYEIIPDQHDFFSSHFIGEGLVRPYPEQLYQFIIGPIPRALWTSKPVDPLWEWYNSVITGNVNGRVGTTVAKGEVGTWYFNYGFWGVIEGGFLVGWLMGLCERCLQNSGGRPMGLLMSLGFGVWLFRIYRDFTFNELYGFIIGAIVLAILSNFFRAFAGGAPQSSGGDPYLQHAHDASLSL